MSIITQNLKTVKLKTVNASNHKARNLILNAEHHLLQRK